MKLIRIIPKNDLDGNVETIHIAESGDLESLQIQGTELALTLDCENPFWENTLPIMGDKKIEDVKEFTLALPNKQKLRIIL